MRYVERFAFPQEYETSEPSAAALEQSLHEDDMIGVRESEQVVTPGPEPGLHPSLSDDRGHLQDLSVAGSCSLWSGGPRVLGERPQKYYAVRRGSETGIFRSWSQCEPRVVGYKGAQYKSFRTLEEAEDFMIGKI